MAVNFVTCHRDSRTSEPPGAPDHRRSASVARSVHPRIRCTAMTSCPSCGHENPAGQRFCGDCGTPLDPAPARRIEVDEERKVVSVLFVDIVGSTERADGADPEDVRELNQIYYTEVSHRIDRYGGATEKYVGDAVMAVFGAPASRSDDAERAVRAALSVLEGIEELTRRHDGP